MHASYKVLTLIVLGGLVCYSGRSLNEKQRAEAGQAPELAQKADSANDESVKTEKGKNDMSTSHTWNRTKENLHIAKDNIAEESEKLWDKTKEGSKKAAHKVSEESEEIWDKTKETSAEAWHKTKEVSAKTWNKAKNVVHGSEKTQAKNN